MSLTYEEHKNLPMQTRLSLFCEGIIDLRCNLGMWKSRSLLHLLVHHLGLLTVLFIAGANSISSSKVSLPAANVARGTGPAYSLVRARWM